MYGFSAKSTIAPLNIPSIINKMTTLFERNEDRVTGFLKWTDFSSKNEFDRSFFGRIQDTIICFQDYLTFNMGSSPLM